MEWRSTDRIGTFDEAVGPPDPHQGFKPHHDDIDQTTMLGNEDRFSYGMHEEDAYRGQRPAKTKIELRKERALTMMSKGLSVEETAGALGITKEAVYVWRNRDPEFKEAMNKLHKPGPARRDQYEALHQLELDYDDYDGPLGFEEWAVQQIQGRP